jgi:hypothetical protein
MKNVIIIAGIYTTLLAGTFMLGCQSPAEKVDEATTKVENAQENLKEVKQDANTKIAANAEEWKIFKTETEAKIKSNEVYIADLKQQMKKTGKNFDAMNSKKIDSLETKNTTMRTKIEDYDKNLSDWETFKREFNHDMAELGQALKDFTVNNKK